MRGRTLISIASLFAACVITCLPLHAAQDKPEPAASGAVSATVPLQLEDNRVFIELGFRRRDGTLRKARAWVDTGGGAFIVTEALADELKLVRQGQPESSDVGRMDRIAAPSVFLGDMPLDLRTAVTYAVLGVKRIDPGVDAEAFLPARVMKQYCAVFDYPARKFTLARPGVLKPRGERVPSPIQPESGFPRIEVTVDGQAYGFLLDTGAAYTMISRNLLDRWVARHPDWARLTGAVSEANMIGDKMETEALLLRLPEMAWGPFKLVGVGAVSRPQGTFELYMSRMMTAPIVGAIAGNVLNNFRVQIDYPKGVTYLEMPSLAESSRLDAVGIVVRVAADGSVFVSGVAKKDGKPAVEGLQPEDKLLQIDGVKLSGATLAQVIAALHGSEGETKRLVIERAGKPIAVEVRVARFL